MTDRIGPNKAEPQPRPNDRPAVWDLVIADMQNRDAAGAAKYGTRLQPFNGRRPLVDAYQEALDLVAYLRQAIEEQPNPRGSVEQPSEGERLIPIRRQPTSVDKWEPGTGSKSAIYDLLKEHDVYGSGDALVCAREIKTRLSEEASENDRLRNELYVERRRHDSSEQADPFSTPKGTDACSLIKFVRIDIAFRFDGSVMVPVEKFDAAT